MATNRYNSVADRKRMERFRRIREQKDAMHDVVSSRDERRRQKKTLYCLRNLDISRMCNEKVAVVCTAKVQVKNILTKAAGEASKANFWLSSNADIFDYIDGSAAIGVVVSEYFFGESKDLRIESTAWFERRGYELIDYCDLFPVADLGEIRTLGNVEEFLFEI